MRHDRDVTSPSMARGGPGANGAPSVSHQPDEGTVLLDIVRSDKDTLRASWAEYGGTSFLSLRIWTRHRSDTLLPTRRGISIRPHELAAVSSAIEAATQLAEGDRS